MTSFLKKWDKLLKSRNQILCIKQLNFGDFKFNSQISSINLRKRLHKKKKVSQNLIVSVKAYTHVLRYSISSFGEKTTLDFWLIFKTNKTLSSWFIGSLIKVIELVGIFFCREYHHKDCTLSFVHIFFLSFACFARLHEICVYNTTSTESRSKDTLPSRIIGALLAYEQQYENTLFRMIR